MSGECVYDLVAAGAPAAAADGNTQRTIPAAAATKKSRRAPPPTASTFAIHGTSAVVANAGGEYTEPSVHPSRKPIGTFGREVGSTVTPENFLRKNEGPLTASRGAPTVDNTNFKKSEYQNEKTKPDVPLRHERPVMGLRTDKNFVVANAVENTLAVPTKVMPPPQPRATDREDFGRVPQYITEIKGDLNARKKMLEDMKVADAAAQERWSELSQSELAQLRDGLQRRWDALNKEYQTKGLSKLETPSQRAHQELVEKQLVAVEFAMHKLSRQHVYIFDDQR
ncbi:Calmodulin-binding [Novymonas esmeraldas]|uniref:Calmodulin-binding n=1 Tax=Novymonas esmeraldas TaxID=1808958 RepID=A0AAW0EP05_9TRYP